MSTEITAATELDALRSGTVVRDRDGAFWWLRDGAWFLGNGRGGTSSHGLISLGAPLTVWVAAAVHGLEGNDPGALAGVVKGALGDLCGLDDEFGLSPEDVRWVRERARAARAALGAGEAKPILTRGHHPVGAYLPVCQVDGDCSCGRGERPCPDTPRVRGGEAGMLGVVRGAGLYPAASGEEPDGHSVEVHGDYQGVTFREGDMVIVTRVPK